MSPNCPECGRLMDGSPPLTGYDEGVGPLYVVDRYECECGEGVVTNPRARKEFFGGTVEVPFVGGEDSL